MGTSGWLTLGAPAVCAARAAPEGHRARRLQLGGLSLGGGGSPAALEAGGAGGLGRGAGPIRCGCISCLRCCIAGRRGASGCWRPGRGPVRAVRGSPRMAGPARAARAPRRGAPPRGAAGGGLGRAFLGVGLSLGGPPAAALGGRPRGGPAGKEVEYRGGGGGVQWPRPGVGPAAARGHRARRGAAGPMGPGASAFGGFAGGARRRGRRARAALRRGRSSWPPPPPRARNSIGPPRGAPGARAPITHRAARPRRGRRARGAPRRGRRSWPPPPPRARDSIGPPRGAPGAAAPVTRRAARPRGAPEAQSGRTGTAWRRSVTACHPPAAPR
jgi:hypothetical protein